jgi:two-component system chemotaxis response regulator CheB
MIRLLVVDDSALMRKCVVALFDRKGDFLVRTARNGVEALDCLDEFKPDVITLDINMPEMDGLTCLSHIMTRHPCPVVMVSSLTTKGALATFEALALGAVDFVAKPNGTISLNLDAVANDLEIKVRSAVGSRFQRKPRQTQQTQTPLTDRDRSRTGAGAHIAPPEGVVVIGVSTGGPQALELVLPQLPAELRWPVLVAQHMPAAFTGSFAQRLDRLCALRVVEVAHPMPIAPGTIYLARGETDMVLARRTDGVTAMPRPTSERYTWHPSVDALAESALKTFAPTAIIGVLLTGMGNDGAASMTQIRKQGGKTIAESEQSCVVFGMPRELIQSSGASVVLNLEQIPNQIVQWLHWQDKSAAGNRRAAWR